MFAPVLSLPATNPTSSEQVFRTSMGKHRQRLAEEQAKIKTLPADLQISSAKAEGEVDGDMASRQDECQTASGQDVRKNVN